MKRDHGRPAVPGAGAEERAPGSALLPVLFFASGAAGLVYEVVWLRLFAGVFGVTLHATSVVVACFMGGMAAGAVVAGRVLERRGRGLLLYGGLEIALGLAAMAMPAAVAALGAIYSSVYDRAAGVPGMLTLLRTLTSSLLLLLPAAFMGGTLPALCHHLAARGVHVGEVGARLYAVNTLGATAGIALAVVWLIPRFGARGAGMLTASVNLAVGAAALLLARRARAAGGPAPESRSSTPAPAPVPESPSARAVSDGPWLGAAPLAAALSGFASLGYQLIWVRAVGLNAADTIFSFGATLSAFLAGIALGSRALARRPIRTAGWFHLAACQVGIAVFAAVSPFVIRLAFSPLAMDDTVSLEYLLGRHWLLVFGALLGPTLLMGATVALAFRLHEAAAGQGASGVGRVYAANTLGAIAGSLVTGLGLVPALGMTRALVPLIALNLAAAVLAHRRGRAPVPAPGRKTGDAVASPWTSRLTRPGVAVAAALALVLVVSRPAFYARPSGATVASLEDSSGVVDVVEEDGVRTMVANRVNNWGTSAPDNLASSLRQGLLPLLLHPHPRRIVEVGLATGVASAPFPLDERVEQVTVVEISTAIAAASRFFDQWNGGITRHPKVRIVVDDGRSALMLTRATFDVVVLGLFTPYSPWASLLFSRELYLAARERLAPGGLLVHWLPLQQLTPAALRSILVTFLGVFPAAHAWEKAQYLALVGWRDEAAPSARTFEAVRSNPALRAMAEQTGFDSAAGFLATYFMGPRAMADFSRGALPNTENEPRVEWSPVQVHQDRFAILAENLGALLPRRSLDEMPVRDLDEPARQALAAAFEARGHSLRAALHEVKREHRLAYELYRRAFALNPRDEFAGPQLGKYRRALEAARREGAMPGAPPGAEPGARPQP